MKILNTRHIYNSTLHISSYIILQVGHHAVHDSLTFKLNTKWFNLNICLLILQPASERIALKVNKKYC